MRAVLRLLALLRFALGFAVLALAAAPAARAQPASAPSPEAAVVRQLIEISGASEMGVQMAAGLMTNLRPLLGQAYPDVPPALMDELFEEMRAELSRIDMVALLTPIYVRHFTLEELEGLVAFYSSPLGRRTVELMPVVLQESMAAGEAWGAEAGRRAVDALARKLAERGYEPRD